MRLGSWLSCFQSGYLAQALKRQLVMATERSFLTQRSFLTKIGPESRVQIRLVGHRWNFTRRMSTWLLRKTSCAVCFSRADATIRLTSSTRARLRMMSAKTHGMASNFPGQSVLLCGQASHVEA